MKFSRTIVPGTIVLCGAALSLAACAVTPMGPTVLALPPQDKPFEVFQEEQAGCRQYAEMQVRGEAQQANSTGAMEGLGGAALGAGLGAAIGGGRGAGIGAASGAIVGSSVGAGTSSQQQMGIQQQYNNAYAQCMVAKGNKIQRPSAPYRPAGAYPPPYYYYYPPPVVYAAPPPPPYY